MKLKLLIGLTILAGIILFFAFDLQTYLTLEYLKSSRENFVSLYSRYPWLSLGSFFLIYILVAAFNLPGGAALGLLGGAVFGFTAATVVISFASTIGATMACLLTRYMFRDLVASRFNEKMKSFEKGFAKEGAWYLFTLRLVPLFPFFMINMAMGLTKMHWLKFYIVSQLGMLPGTMVYVNAGHELGKIDSLSGILSPSLIASFTLLGIFPIIARKSLELYKRKRQ